MDVGGIVAHDVVRRVAVALHQRRQLLARDPGEHRGVGDLVAVEVEDREDGAVRHRVEELVRVPARGERAGLGLAVADDRAHDEVRVVERGAVRVAQRVAELAALVDRARRLGRDVARDAAREAELPEQLPDPLRVAGDRRVDLAVRPLEVRVGDDGRPAVARADDVDRVEVAGLDDPVHVDVEHVQARRRAPVAEQARLDVLRPERRPEQRVVEQVDLADRQVVRGPPVRVEELQLVVGEGPGRGRRGCSHHGTSGSRYGQPIATGNATRAVSPRAASAHGWARRRHGTSGPGPAITLEDVQSGALRPPLGATARPDSGAMPLMGVGTCRARSRRNAVWWALGTIAGECPWVGIAGVSSRGGASPRSAGTSSRGCRRRR